MGVNDAMPQILWTWYFLEAQGYQVKDSVIYQDNQSSILLEKNGCASSGKRTRHINIRYFFITDRIEKKEVRVEYCPTGEMVADFFTKPLQGVLFCQFQNRIMGSDPVTNTMSQDHRSVLNKPDLNLAREESQLARQLVNQPAGQCSGPIRVEAMPAGQCSGPICVTDTNDWTTVKQSRNRQRQKQTA